MRDKTKPKISERALLAKRKTKNSIGLLRCCGKRNEIIRVRNRNNRETFNIYINIYISGRKKRKKHLNSFLLGERLAPKRITASHTHTHGVRIVFVEIRL